MNIPSPSNIYFTQGIPISAYHIESDKYGKTEYDDFVEIWYDEYGKYYAINVRGFEVSSNNTFIYHHYSDTHRIIIFYI